MIAGRRIFFVSAIVLVIAAILYSCKEKYLPELKETNVNYLVVEGLRANTQHYGLLILSRRIAPLAFVKMIKGPPPFRCPV